MCPMSPKLLRPRANYAVRYPVRAAHVGGSARLSTTPVGQGIAPTAHLGGTYGDLRVLGAIESGNTITVDISAAFTGQTVDYASLEIVLVDANDRIVGWGNTRTGWPDDGLGSPPTNGVGGTVMTLTLRQFPEVVGGWVLNGKNAAFSPLASYAWLPVSPYKRVDTSLIPGLQAPTAPTGVAVAGGESNLSIAWTAPYSDSAITGYVVEYTPAGGSATTRSTGSSATMYLLTFLTNGTAYTVRVAAVSAVGTGPYSSASSPATPRTVPDSPAFALTGFATAGNAQVALSWTPPASNGGAPITDYVVQFSSNGGSTWTTFADGTSATTSATVTGLNNGTAYLFRVAAVNVAGTGPYATTTSSVTPLPPAPSLWKVETYSPVYHWSM